MAAATCRASARTSAVIPRPRRVAGRWEAVLPCRQVTKPRGSGSILLCRSSRAGRAPLVPGRLAGPSDAHAFPWTGWGAAGVAGRGTKERKQPPGPSSRQRERAGGGRWWRRKGRSSRLSPNRNSKQQRLLLGSASRNGNAVVADRASGWGEGGFTAAPRGPAPESPRRMRACTRAGSDMRPASCEPLPARPIPLACTYMCTDTPIFPHVGRWCVEANPGVKIPEATHLPARARRTGDPDRLGSVGKTPKCARVCDTPFEGFGRLAPLVSSLSSWRLMVFTTEEPYPVGHLACPRSDSTWSRGGEYLGTCGNKAASHTVARSSVNPKALPGRIFVGLPPSYWLSDLLGAVIQDRCFVEEPCASSWSLDKDHHKSQPTLG